MLTASSPLGTPAASGIAVAQSAAPPQTDFLRVQLAQRIVDFLNELVLLDKPAIAAMCANRVICNEQLALHPTVQCHAQHGAYHVGLLGILNGLCGVREDGCGMICMEWTEDCDSPFIDKTPELVGFKLTPQKPEVPT